MSHPEKPPEAAGAPRPTRRLSIDALRGFDMFWILGGTQLAQGLEKAGLGGGFLTRQLTHCEWEGFRFFDGIFPLFLFLVGVSIVMSMDAVVARTGKRGAFFRVLKRSALLFGIGVFYYGGVSKLWPDVAVSGVLHRIAICYLAGASLYLLLPRRFLGGVAVVILAGYWALLSFVPFPGIELKKLPKSEVFKRSAEEVIRAENPAWVHGRFEEGMNLSDSVDFRYLPGRKNAGYYANEGLLSTLPAIVTVLFGILAGNVLKEPGWSGYRKAGILALAGCAGMGLGLLWGSELPVIKRIWTSSFCLVASGFSALMLAVFWVVVEEWKFQRWTRPFLWIGSNAITGYVLVRVVDFNALAGRFVGGDVSRFLETFRPGTGVLLQALVALALPILVLRFLYLRSIFIRI